MAAKKKSTATAPKKSGHKAAKSSTPEVIRNDAGVLEFADDVFNQPKDACHVQAIDSASIFGAQQTGALSNNVSEDTMWKYWKRWAFAASNATGTGIMMAPFTAQTRNSDGEWEDNPDHQLSKLLKFINPFMTSAEFKYWVTVDLEMTGTSYWKIVENGMGEPGELWPLIGKMTPKLGKDKKKNELLGWTHTLPDNSKEELEPEEVLFLRYPWPGKMWGGYGPAMAAASELQLDNELVQTMWAKFKQGVFPSALLFMKTKDDETRQNYVEKMEGKFSGTQNAGRVMGLADTMRVEWPPIKPIIGEIKAKDGIRDTILGVMRVPKSVLGLDADANRASIWGMQAMFGSLKLKPITVLLEQRLDQQLASMFGDDVRVKFGSVMPVDEELAMKQEEQDLKYFVISIDEARARRKDLGPSTWGEIPIAPIGVAPLGTVDHSGEGGQSSQQRATIAEFKLGIEDKKMEQMGAYTREQRKRIMNAYAKATAPFEEKYVKIMGAFFNKLEAELMAAWKKDSPSNQAFKTPNINKILDVKSLKARVLKAKKTIDRAGVYLGGSFEQGVIDPDQEFTVWSKTSKSARDAADAYGSRYADEIANETTREVKAVIKKAVKDQATWDELRLAISDKMGEMSVNRANAIATTETTRLWNAGGQTFRYENEILKKQWMASFVNTRPTHAAADGQVVDNDEQFEVGDDAMMFPGEGSVAEENVFCRCAAVGFIERKRT
jgi:phage portal protein BeeE